MIRDPRAIRSALIFTMLITPAISWASVSKYSDKDSLKLKSSDKPHLVMELEMPSKLYKKITTARGEDLDLENTIIKFNGDTVSINDAHLHGQTTLYYERKSYSVDANKKIKLCKGCDGLGAFYLVSLSMDRNYYHNRLSFDLLKTLGLFNLQYAYSEVKINGNSQGIYLILQRPQDWALKDRESPYIVRRGAEHLVERERFQKDLDKTAKKKYHDQFMSIYKIINQYSGEDLHTKLNEVMHLEDYMRWLAFNYIIKCGDYSDELYFYSDPQSKKFRIVPWDYDDIFMIHPHEGIKERNLRLDPSSLIFSSEDKLDVKIATDGYLYDQYLKHFSAVMEELSKEKLEKVLTNIYSDLSSLYESKPILEAASKDGYKTSPAILRRELNTVYDFFEGQRMGLLNKKTPAK
ncbi:MAG TPA: CotH kinase family protein [Chryseolinea sp.]|nr:CotH kinase family protein [Chryseolinea sp.]